MKISLTLIAVLTTLGVGLVFASTRTSEDAPTLSRTVEPTPAPHKVKVIPKPKVKVKPKPKPPSHRAFINIPRLGIKQDVTMALDDGPAFWPVTGRPGDGDTIAIAGHRTTHTAPFLRLNELELGDRIYVRYQGHAYAYLVTSTRVRSVKNLHIADAVGYERLLLSACSTSTGEPTSLSYRIVVYAKPSQSPRWLNSRAPHPHGNRALDRYPLAASPRARGDRLT